MKIRNPNKPGLVEKIALGTTSAVLTAASAMGLIVATNCDVKYAAFSLAAPLVTTGIDFAIQRAKNNDIPLLSRRYATALGVSAIGAGIAYAALAASTYIYFKYYFSLSFNFGI